MLVGYPEQISPYRLSGGWDKCHEIIIRQKMEQAQPNLFWKDTQTAMVPLSPLHPVRVFKFTVPKLCPYFKAITPW
jgi:hypothetical protein